MCTGLRSHADKSYVVITRLQVGWTLCLFSFLSLIFVVGWFFIELSDVNLLSVLAT